jgi:hypothetical protein
LSPFHREVATAKEVEARPGILPVRRLDPGSGRQGVDRHGMPIMVRLNGEIETWWRHEDQGEAEES